MSLIGKMLVALIIFSGEVLTALKTVTVSSVCGGKITWDY